MGGTALLYDPHFQIRYIYVSDSVIPLTECEGKQSVWVNRVCH